MARLNTSLKIIQVLTVKSVGQRSTAIGALLAIAGAPNQSTNVSVCAFVCKPGTRLHVSNSTAFKFICCCLTSTYQVLEYTMQILTLQYTNGKKIPKTCHHCRFHYINPCSHRHAQYGQSFPRFLPRKYHARIAPTASHKP